MEKYRLEGLDCADCGLKLEKALLKEEYVEQVSISFATKTMLIQTSNLEKVKELINKIEPEVEILEANKSKADVDAEHELASLDTEKMLIIISFILFSVAFIVELFQKYGRADRDLYLFLYLYI